MASCAVNSGRNHKPLPMGVSRGPLSAILLVWMDFLALSGMVERPFTRMGLTSTSSQSIGACQTCQEARGEHMACLGGGKDLADGLSDLDADAITGDKGDQLVSLRSAGRRQRRLREALRSK